MQPSNFSELRRVRSEMSKTASHSARRYVDLLAAYREKYRDRLVNHGAATEQIGTCRPTADMTSDEEPSAAAG